MVVLGSTDIANFVRILVLVMLISRFYSDSNEDLGPGDTISLI